MNDAIKIGLVAAGVLLIQVATGPLLSLGGARPDFVLIFVLLMALQRGRIVGLWTGFFAGLALDFVALGYIGVFALCKSTLAFWTGVWLDDRVGSVAIGWWMFILMTASFLQGAVVGVIVGPGGDMSLTSYLLQIVIPSTLYTGFVGFLWAVAPMGARSRGPLAPASTRGRRSLR